MTSSRLNARQQSFVNAYTGGSNGVRGNATNSAKAAGYKQPHVQGPRLLENVRVAAAIEERQQHAADAAQLSLDDYVGECLELARWWKRHDERPDSTSAKALELAGKALGYLDRRERETGWQDAQDAADNHTYYGVALLPRGATVVDRHVAAH